MQGLALLRTVQKRYILYSAVYENAMRQVYRNCRNERTVDG